MQQDGAFRFCVSQWKARERKGQQNKSKDEQHEDIDTEESDAYVISDISGVTLDNSQSLTLKLVNSGSFFRLQPDTGAQCNIAPVHLYKQACNDEDSLNGRTVNITISAYGGSRLPVGGEVILKVSHDETKCKLNCKLVDSEDICPILGRKACLSLVSRFMQSKKMGTNSYPRSSCAINSRRCSQRESENWMESTT